MKDFYDVHFLSRHYAFEGKILSQAIAATFMVRGTAIPAGEIYPLTAAFSGDAARQRLWVGFLNRLGLTDVETSFTVVTHQIAAFVQLPLQAAGKKEPFHLHWPSGGPWE